MVVFKTLVLLSLVYRLQCLLSLLNLIVFHLLLTFPLLVVILLICFSKVNKISFLKHKPIKSRKRAFTKALKTLLKWVLGLMNCTLCNINSALTLISNNLRMKPYDRLVLVIKCLPTMLSLAFLLLMTVFPSRL